MNRLFDQPKAEAALQSLLEASQAHGKDITLLKKLHDFSPDSDGDAGGIILRKLQSIEATLNSLESRVRSIERAIEIPGSTRSDVTIGQGVASNRKTLARALNLISVKANAEEVEKSGASQNEAIAETSEELKVTQRSLENSNAAINSLSQRIDVLSAEMKTKVDDSAIKLIQADASLISQHCKFQRTTNETISATKNDIKAHDADISKNSVEISALATRLSTLKIELDHRASRESLDSVLQKVSHISKTLTEKVQRSDFDSLQSTFHDKNIIIARLEQDLQSVISSQHAASVHLSNQLREQRDAVGQVVSGCASREALAATHAQVQRTEQSLVELGAEHLVTKKQAALAAQFIAWYGNAQNEKASVVGFDS